MEKKSVTMIEATELIGMGIKTLKQLVENKILPVNSDGCIDYELLIAYEKFQEERRRVSMDRMVELSEEMGLYD